MTTNEIVVDLKSLPWTQQYEYSEETQKGRSSVIPNRKLSSSQNFVHNSCSLHKCSLWLFGLLGKRTDGRVLNSVKVAHIEDVYATDGTEVGVATVVGQTAMIPPSPKRVGPSCASYPRINLDTSEVPRSI